MERQHERRSPARRPAHRRPARGPVHRAGRQGSGRHVPPDRAPAATRRGAERPHRPPRRRRLRRRGHLRRPGRNADRRSARRRRPPLQPLPHDVAVRPHPVSDADRPQPPRRGHGRRAGGRDLGAGLQLDPAQGGGPDRRGPAPQRVQHGAVRQVPRGPGLGDEPDRSLRRLADRRRRVRALLRLHRRRVQPVLPGAVQRDDARRAASGARRTATTSPRT